MNGLNGIPFGCMQDTSHPHDHMRACVRVHVRIRIQFGGDCVTLEILNMLYSCWTLASACEHAGIYVQYTQASSSRLICGHAYAGCDASVNYHASA
eukprot:701958-Pelagomonas_calceolata.AAC.1